MHKYDRIVILRDTTMKVVAEKSLVGLSMRQVSATSGINQSLIYRDFGSKEKLLSSCYDSSREELKSVMYEIYLQDVNNPSILEERIKKNWNLLTDTLIANDYKTIYLCEYRERHSKNIGLIEPYFNHEGTGSGIIRENSCFDSNDRRCFYRDVVEHFIETSIHHSKKVLRGNIPDLPENRDKVWNILRGILKTID